MYIANTLPKINVDQHHAETEALRAKLLQLGRLIHKCGERPTAEIFAECVTLSPEARDEVIRRLEDFTRFGPERYRATGADRFIEHLIGTDGGSR